MNYGGLLRSTGGFLQPVSKSDGGRFTRGALGTVCFGILRTGFMAELAGAPVNVALAVVPAKKGKPRLASRYSVT